MQSVPIRELGLTQLETILWLIQRHQVDTEEVVSLITELVPALAPDVHTATRTKASMHIQIARLGRLGPGSVVVDFLSRCRAQELEVRAWVLDSKVDQAEFLTECAIAARYGFQLCGIELDLISDAPTL